MALADSVKSFIWGAGGQKITPEQLTVLRALQAKKKMQGADTSPVASWTQGAARVVDALGDVVQERRLDSQDRQLQADDAAMAAPLTQALTGLYTGGDMSGGAAAAGGSPAAQAYNAAPVVATGEIADYIRQSAAARGIDPDIALRVAQSEGGLSDPVRQSEVVKNGVREASYGPFQLYMGGGLGNKALEAGIDPRDPNQWKQGVDFALDQAKQGGWGPWYGAKKIGVTGMAGIGNAPIEVASTAPIMPVEPAALAPVTATDAIETISPQQGYVDPMVTTEYQAPPPPMTAPQNQPQTQAPQVSPQALAAQVAPQQTAQAQLPQAPQIQGVPPQVLAQAIQAAQSPYASERTKGIANALIQRQQAVQAAQQEQQQFIFQQQYEQAQQANDPLRQVQIQKAQQELEQGRNPTRPLINSGDGRLYDPNTQQWILAPNSGADVPDSVRALELRAERAGLQPGTPEYNQFMISGGSGGTSLSVGPDGTVQFNQGGAGGKALTEAQSKDAFFAARMANSMPTLDKYEQSLMSLPEAAAGSLPGGRYLQSEEYQLAKDAGDDFVATYLRKDSGAALTKEEREEYGRMLLPQPTDKPALIEAKRLRRQVAAEAIRLGLPQTAVDNMVKAVGKIDGAGQPVSATPTAENPLPPQTNAPRKTSSGVQWSID